ncbi:MAG: hypothetical protein A4E27_00159 [Methanobacterium sp. PtaU1.Bin242]|nr:MAG: hypothetical protein A4E27_00159 [Methanobacterium sp. PtaU1.Bin242]
MSDDMAVAIEQIPLEPLEFETGFKRIKKALDIKWHLAHRDILETIRWVIALYLNESPKYCWADLVTWSLGWHGFGEVSEAHDCGYCGKCDCMTDKVRAENGFTKPRCWSYNE